jgi:uncharacterized membrane protein
MREVSDTSTDNVKTEIKGLSFLVTVLTICNLLAGLVVADVFVSLGYVLTGVFGFMFFMIMDVAEIYAINVFVVRIKKRAKWIAEHYGKTKQEASS